MTKEHIKIVTKFIEKNDLKGAKLHIRSAVSCAHRLKILNKIMRFYYDEEYFHKIAKYLIGKNADTENKYNLHDLLNIIGQIVYFNSISPKPDKNFIKNGICIAHYVSNILDFNQFVKYSLELNNNQGLFMPSKVLEIFVTNTKYLDFEQIFHYICYHRGLLFLYKLYSNFYYV